MDDAATASARLRRKLELLEPFVGLPARRLLQHPHAPEIYPRYLAAGYHVTCAMLELMEAALARARELDDEISAGLVRYLERHLIEETHHERLVGLSALTTVGAVADAMLDVVGQPVVPVLRG